MKSFAILASAFSLVATARPAQADPRSDKDSASARAASGNAVASAQADAAPRPQATVQVAASSQAAAEGAPAAASAPATSPLPESAPPQATSANGASSWFARAPLTVTAGQGAEQWRMTFFGFVEADFIYDTTRSYSDAMGGSIVARRDTFEGREGRYQASMRNTRLGMMFESPVIAGITPSAVLEGDFFGNHPMTIDPRPSDPTHTHEATFYASPNFRVRHAYLKLQNEYVDVVAGQTYDVFGWQNYFFPCSAQFLGLPNQLFSRNTQIRLARTFNTGGPISVDVAASAVRPAQRDSAVPDGNAGVRFSVDSWKGITTPGNIGTVALPLSIGVSGTVRQFKVNAFTPPPTQNANTATGWGLSVDALIPIIPAANAGDRGNRLTLTGSFVTGTGIGDLITAGGGATFPTLPNPGQMNPPPLYHGNIDNGLVSFDRLGVLHTIDWQAFKVGLQYYLPPSGRLILSANYTQAHSKNLGQLFPKGGTEVELLVRVADTSRYADVNLFWDATPSVRLGLSGVYTQVQYLLDSAKPHNIRAMAQALYAF